MKYTANRTICHYTTEDGRYTIKKKWATGSYIIYDNENHCNLHEGIVTVSRGRLKDAKAYVERLYAEKGDNVC